jgi:hypothetical protein
MHTNPSRAMTAFSDFPAPAEHALHPAAEQIHAYLAAYASAFGVTRAHPLRHAGSQRSSRAGRWTGSRSTRSWWRRDGSGGPRLPGAVRGFRGELLHAFDYPGAGPFRDRRTLVYGNGNQRAGDRVGPRAARAGHLRLPQAALRDPEEPRRGLLRLAVVHAVRRAGAAPLPAEWARRQRERILRVAGDPADFGAPEPSEDLRVAGLSLCQDYLAQVATAASPAARRSPRRRRTGHVRRRLGETVEAIVCATGYDLDLPTSRDRRGCSATAGLYQRTFHPDLPARRDRPVPRPGPVLPAARAAGALDRRGLERRGRRCPTTRDAARDAPAPPLDAHNALALTLSRSSASRPSRWTGTRSASRSCSARCSRPATASRAPVHSRRRASASRPNSRVSAAPVEMADPGVPAHLGLTQTAELLAVARR